MIPGLRFRTFVCALNSSVNSQPKTPKVRDDRLGSGDQLSTAERDEGCIVHIV
jgi:hypothetical protein